MITLFAYGRCTIDPTLDVSRVAAALVMCLVIQGTRAEGAFVFNEASVLPNLVEQADFALAGGGRVDNGAMSFLDVLESVEPRRSDWFLQSLVWEVFPATRNSPGGSETAGSSQFSAYSQTLAPLNTDAVASSSAPAVAWIRLREFLYVPFAPRSGLLRPPQPFSLLA